MLRSIEEFLRPVNCPYKGYVTAALKTAIFLLEMRDYATPVLNAELIPGTRSHTLGGDSAANKTKEFLTQEGFVGDGITADDIYQQMKNYADPQPDSMTKLVDDLADAKKACDAAEARLERAKEDAAKHGK
jgi:hypothetical protein